MADDEVVAPPRATDGSGSATRWPVVALGTLCRKEPRYGSSLPAEAHDWYLPRYIRISDIDHRGRLRRHGRASLSWPAAEPYRLESGDVLFARSGSTVGKTYLYREDDGACAHAGYLIRFALDGRRCLPQYLAYYTQTPAYWKWVERTKRQAAQPNINATEYAGLPVPLPPVPQQRRIVDLLAESERLLRASERILDTLRAMKRGLVAELLSGRRSVPGGSSGRSLSATSLGLLPEHWQVQPVEALLAPVAHAMRSGPFGSELKKSELVARGIPLLGIDNVGVDTFVPVYRRFVDAATHVRLARFAVRADDVLITIMGTVGRACLVPRDIGDALSSKHIWTLSFDPRRYLPELVAAQCNHAPWVRAHFRRDEQGGTMGAIRSQTLRTVLLPVPPMDEQRQIADVLRACAARLDCEQRVLARHELLRQGLLEQLFAGPTRPRASES